MCLRICNELQKWSVCASVFLQSGLPTNQVVNTESPTQPPSPHSPLHFSFSCCALDLSFIPPGESLRMRWCIGIHTVLLSVPLRMYVPRRPTPTTNRSGKGTRRQLLLTPKHLEKEGGGKWRGGAGTRRKKEQGQDPDKLNYVKSALSKSRSWQIGLARRHPSSLTETVCHVKLFLVRLELEFS